jgi:hypothetical protein
MQPDPVGIVRATRLTFKLAVIPEATTIAISKHYCRTHIRQLPAAMRQQMSHWLLLRLLVRFMRQDDCSDLCDIIVI